MDAACRRRPIFFGLHPCLDQDGDLAVMPAIRIGKRADLNFFRRYAGLQQRVTDGIRALVAEIAIVTIEPLGIHVVVDADTQGRILGQVSRDHCRFLHVVVRHGRIVATEIEFPVWRPTRDDADVALCTDRSVAALRALEAGRSGGARVAGHRHAGVTGLTAFALQACGACVAGSAGRTDERGALRARITGITLLTCGALRTHGTGRTLNACTLIALSARITRRSLRTHGTWRALCADNHGAGGTCRSHIALRTALACRSDCTLRTAQAVTRFAGCAGWTLRAGWARGTCLARRTDQALAIVTRIAVVMRSASRA